MKLNKKVRQLISGILSTLIILVTLIPNIVVADNLYDSIDNCTENEYYKNEEIIFTLGDMIYTDASVNGNTIIKVYSKDGKLIEKVKVDKETNIMESIKYDNDKNNLKNEPSIVRIDLNEYKIEEIKNNQVTPLATRINLGRTTYRSTTSPYFRAMSVSYTTDSDRVSYEVPSNLKTMGKLLAFLISFIKLPEIIASRVLRGLISAGIVIVGDKGEEIFFSYFTVSAKRTDREFWGEDSPYSGSLSGTLYEVETKSSKYYGEQFKEGVYFDPSVWGRGDISRILGPYVYGGFYEKLTYVSEGK